jgi:2-polyprenyl-3-methyl-5-hydroxy-6-metoxy-1,4-benzoquinol methylase
LFSLKAAALRHQQAGELECAEARYREVLESTPNDADCLHMLGVICYQTGRLREALRLIDQALDLTGWQFDSMRYNLGFVISRLLEGPELVSDWPSETMPTAADRDASEKFALRAVDLDIRPLSLPQTDIATELDHREVLSTVALPFTGERFTPEVCGAIWSDHWHRYCIAAPLVRGLRVLDAACGEGYGSFLLAGEARSVVGIDMSNEAVAHARKRYAAANLTYIQASVAALPLPDASVDVVVSFETIEHLAAQVEMLSEFRRVLIPSGILIISSPNKPIYSAANESPNEFHVRELTRDELAVLLKPGFPHQRWYGQRAFAHSLLWAERFDGLGEPRIEKPADGAVRALEVPLPPMYFVVICGGPDATLPELAALSALVRSDDGARLVSADRLLWLRGS